MAKSTGNICGAPGSHPTRVRGLKYGKKIVERTSTGVAPHPGAWIEIVWACITDPTTKSHPTRVRGLKYDSGQLDHPGAAVAPHPGAWIEIGVDCYVNKN